MADKPAKKRSGDGITENPVINIGGEWVPAHEAWAKMEAASEIADSIERFNMQFPNLTTDATREVVPVVRQRLKDAALRMPTKPVDAPDLGATVGNLLETLSPEEAIEQLEEKTGEAISMRELIALAGESAYVNALAREAEEYKANCILPEQTAQIWNDMARPAPGGGLWSAAKVGKILHSGQSS